MGKCEQVQNCFIGVQAENGRCTESYFFSPSLSLAVRARAVPTPEEMSNLTPESSPE